MRKIISITYVLAFLFCLSCTPSKYENNDFSIFVYSGKEVFEIEDFLVCKDEEFLYFSLKNKSQEEKIYNEIKIDKIVLKHKESEQIAKPLLVLSSKLPDSPLSFLIGHETHKLEYLEKEEKRWILLAGNDKKTEVLKPILKKCNSCSWENKK